MLYIPQAQKEIQSLKVNRSPRPYGLHVAVNPTDASILFTLQAKLGNAVGVERIATLQADMIKVYTDVCLPSLGASRNIPAHTLLGFGPGVSHYYSGSDTVFYTIQGMLLTMERACYVADPVPSDLQTILSDKLGDFFEVVVDFNEP